MPLGLGKIPLGSTLKRDNMASISEKIIGVSCPYNDKNCPKLEEVNERALNYEKRLANIERVLYIIIGMITINSGLILW